MGGKKRTCVRFEPGRRHTHTHTEILTLKTPWDRYVEARDLWRRGRDPLGRLRKRNLLNFYRYKEGEEENNESAWWRRSNSIVTRDRQKGEKKKFHSEKKRQVLAEEDHTVNTKRGGEERKKTIESSQRQPPIAFEEIEKRKILWPIDARLVRINGGYHWMSISIKRTC